MALALLSALCLASASNADTSVNLIDSSQWGITYGSDPGDCCTSLSGSAPLYDTTTGVIMYSYGQNTISQTIGINQALGSTGIQVSGYSYNWDYRLVSNNGNGGDTLTASISLKNSSGTVSETQNFSYTGATHDTWFNESGSTTFTNPYTDPQSISLSFSGKDGGFWAGYYGPELKNISLQLNYTSAPDPCLTDPLSSISCPGYAEAYKAQQCAIDPLYDSSCPGYAEAYFNQQCGYNPLYDKACLGNSEVLTGKNLVPNPGSWYREVNQSFAINKALSHSGSGLQVHAFRWGFETFGLWGAGDFKSDVNIRDSNGDSIYSFSTGWQNTGTGFTDRSYYYQLPQSRNNLTLGTFEYNTEVTGVSAVGNFWARMLYTPDQCSLDPLSSPTCTGYQAAFLEQQCAIYVMFSPQCPGYAEALQKMLDEQAALSASATTDDPANTVSATTTSSTTTASADPTKDETQVTTDVGGAELTTTGEVVVADGVPSEAKESSKESTEQKDKESADKKQSNVNAVALAQSAARKAEQTALSAASEAQAASLSDNANPTDGIGIASLGSGLTINGLRILQGMGNEQNTVQADNQALAAAARSRSQSQEEQTEQVLTVDKQQESQSVAAAQSASQIEQTTETAKAGPSVRRGGSIDGLAGGDMNALANTPANFNDYIGKQLNDAQFYAARDIYKGQRTVDNARALRGLGTDRLHQEMINQQYGR